MSAVVDILDMLSAMHAHSSAENKRCSCSLGSSVTVSWYEQRQVTWQSFARAARFSDSLQAAVADVLLKNKQLSASHADISAVSFNSRLKPQLSSEPQCRIKMIKPAPISDLHINAGLKLPKSFGKPHLLSLLCNCPAFVLRHMLFGTCLSHGQCAPPSVTLE